MKVLVTGGTGFVGGNVVRELRRRNHEVLCLVRPGSPGEEQVRELGAEIVPGDITHPSRLNMVPQVDAVIHLVGIIREVGNNTFKHVHADGTKYMLDVASRANAKKFIHMSALGTRPNAASNYHQSKWEAEQSVRSYKIPYTIFRPSIVFGQETSGRYGEFVRQMLQLHGKILWLLTPVVGSGQSKMQPIWVEDVARFFAEALENPAMKDQVIELGGPKAYPFMEIQDILCAARYGGAKAHLKMPLWYARLIAWKMDVVPGVAWVTEKIMRMPTFSRDQVRMIPEDSVCDMKAALEAVSMNLMDFELWAQDTLST